MNENRHKNSTEYEKLTQSIYQSIIDNKSTENINVLHNKEIEGASGVKHQIDVYWKFILNNIEYSVIVECKNYNSNISLEKVRNLYGVMEDIKSIEGNVVSVMVTTKGYQSGARKYANYYGIDLKLLRKPIEEDWENLLKDINGNLEYKFISDKTVYTPKVKFNIDRENDELKQLIDDKNINIPSDSRIIIKNENGRTVTEDILIWLPKQLDIIDKETDTWHTEIIKLDNISIPANSKKSHQIQLPIKEMKVKYYIESFSKIFALLGEEVVKEILKDFNTDDVEYINRNI